MRKIHNGNFKAVHLQKIYAEVKENYDRIPQWINIECYGLGAEYFYKCIGCLELLESIVCFHVGMGDCHGLANGEGYNGLKGRIESFAWIDQIDTSVVE